MSVYEDLQKTLPENPRRWLVTGCAGFIASHITETLLNLDQRVVGLDNFPTGYPENLELVRASVGEQKWKNFSFIEGDITDAPTCQNACDGTDLVLHQAALGSVPRSIDNPLGSHHANVTGTLNMLTAAKDQSVARFVFASSSSVYGDDKNLPKVEDRIGRPASPYAATKRMCEIYAATMARTFEMETIGLRYFNVFGARQNPHGPYAAVIPAWLSAMQNGEPVFINGTGETSRDFCYIANAVQANLLAATTENENAINEVYNVAMHAQTSLNDLFAMIRDRVRENDPSLDIADAVHREFRQGDVMHTLADIKKAKSQLGFEPSYSVREGLALTVDWFLSRT
ncbi:MAG: SDR family oxidoreductase [Verrucomicrobiales bacterium]